MAKIEWTVKEDEMLKEIMSSDISKSRTVRESARIAAEKITEWGNERSIAACLFRWNAKVSKVPVLAQEISPVPAPEVKEVEIIEIHEEPIQEEPFPYMSVPDDFEDVISGIARLRAEYKRVLEDNTSLKAHIASLEAQVSSHRPKILFIDEMSPEFDFVRQLAEKAGVSIEG